MCLAQQKPQEATLSKKDNPIAHDAYTHLLQRLPPNSKALWSDVQVCIQPKQGVLIVDNSTLDKPHTSKMALVAKLWSGKHHQVVKGITLISLVWTENAEYRSLCDYCIYNIGVDGVEKNHMLDVAQTRGFAPEMVLFDSWYSSLDSLKHIRKKGWHGLTRLKKNHKVSLHAGQPLSISDV